MSTTTTTTTTQATTVQTPKSKQYDDIYEGPATIESVDATNLRFTEGLTEEEAANAFLIAMRVKPSDEKIAVHTLELEFSDRECKYPKEYVGKKQKDVTREELFRRGLITGSDAANANVADVFGQDIIGKKISIRITKVTNPNKAENNTYHQVYLSNRAIPISNEERARRIAAMTGRPVATAQAAKPVTQNPF